MCFLITIKKKLWTLITMDLNMDFFVKCPTVRERILDREDRISAKQMEFKRKAAKTGKHFY